MAVRRRAVALCASVVMVGAGVGPASAAEPGSAPPPPDVVAGGAPAAAGVPAKVKKRSGRIRAPRVTRRNGKVIARAARTNTRAKPVLFVHGLDAFGSAGNDCAGTWNQMIGQLRTWGYTGTLASVKYYHGDTNCTTTLDTHGSHTKHYPRTDAHQYSSHDMDADIRHLGYHLAWQIYNQYSSKGVTVDLVGHSMGGLIARYAMWGIQNNHVDFPPYAYVEDVVTLGTPHSGSGYAGWCGWAYECNQMNTGSSFMTWMAANAKNPQADGGTDWTAMGSYDDGFVSETSATAMDAAHKTRYFNMGLGHSDYQHDVSALSDADTEYNDNLGPWYLWYDAPHAVKWSDNALYYGTW